MGLSRVSGGEPATTILTAWLVANGETRLTSAYVKDKPNKAGEHNENK